MHATSVNTSKIKIQPEIYLFNYRLFNAFISVRLDYFLLFEGVFLVQLKFINYRFRLDADDSIG